MRIFNDPLMDKKQEGLAGGTTTSTQQKGKEEDTPEPLEIPGAPTIPSGGGDSQDTKEENRVKMASTFIIGFFAILIIAFVYAACAYTSLQELKDFMTSLIGALSGLIGFIIGYYFKTKD